MRVSPAAAREPHLSRHKNQVLQFLLGEAPLMSSALAMKTSAPLPATAPSSTLRAPRDGKDDLLDVPVLEYTSDFESEDDYIDLESELLAESLSSDWTGSPMTATIQDARVNECDATKLAEPTARTSLVEEDPCEMETTAVEEQVRTFTSLIIAAGDVKVVDPHSDTTSNCTEDDGGSSDDGNGADGLLSNEVEEEPSEAAAEDPVIDEKPNHRAPEPSVSSPNGCSLASAHPATSVVTAADKEQDRLDKPVSTESDSRSTSEPDSPHSTQQSHTEPQREAGTTEDEDVDSDGASQQQQSSPEGSPMKPKLRPLPAPTISEIVFVGLVAMSLVLYVLATFYAYYHPILLPLPPLETLQTPLDLSNLSIVVTSPANASLVEQPLYFEWQLTNYPTLAIAKYGPEVFAYRIYVNEKRVVSEIGLLNTSTQSCLIGAGEDHLKMDTCEPEMFTTATRNRIPAHHLPSYARYELRIEVMLPISGSDGAVHILQESIIVTKAFDVTRWLELLAPKPGAVFPLGEAVLLEYRASNVQQLEVVIDGLWRIEKRHIDSGTFLLRGLGEGLHTIELVGLDAIDRRVLSRDGGAGGLTTTIFVGGEERES